MKRRNSREESDDLANRLQNYKTTQAGVAKDRGVYEKRMKANTLTKARRIVYGVKTKNMTCCTAGCPSPSCGKK